MYFCCFIKQNKIENEKMLIEYKITTITENSDKKNLKKFTGKEKLEI
ncbi:hypothetical protein NARC_90131 [Candidatus Nitrosocosmicus arcticus]|uniref:Uncharacterized protein n=1 Tax=Candidatus Nitrosocosmicus arcticus TaxID=2035267 RepID=A0A557SUE6_9ARCH|nr:hypothetical protein NARC_90131 [Candidatus Nitrosocosmicus arcticus]